MATGVAMMVVDVELGDGSAEAEGATVLSDLGVVMFTAKNIAPPLAIRIMITANALNRVLTLFLL